MLLTMQQDVDSTAQFFTVLIIFIIVLVVTVFTTRWLAGYQKQQSAGSNVEVIETQRIANGKYIQIVRVGETYLSIAICKDTVTMLSEIPKDQLTFKEGGGMSVVSFKELLEKTKKINSEKNQ